MVFLKKSDHQEHQKPFTLHGSILSQTQTKSFIRSLEKRNDPLFQLIHEFNVQPTRYIHNSWLSEHIEDAILKELLNSERTEKIISARIQSNLNFEYHYDFSQRHQRLALIMPHQLSTLIYLAGIAINTSRIARIIMAKEVIPLKAILGNDIYQFALKRAPQLMGAIKFSFMDDRLAGDDLHKHIASCGEKCVEACLSKEPAALIHRFRLKFPKDMAWDFSKEVPSDEKKNAWELLRKIFLKEIDRKWLSVLS